MIIILLFELFAAAVVLVPIFAVLGCFYWRDWKRTLVYLAVAFYLTAIYFLVGLPDVTYWRVDWLDPGINIVPLVNIIDDWANALRNIALFVPLGIILPVLWSQKFTKRRTVLFGLATSLTIEVLQL